MIDLILRKINSNKELMTSLRKIYEEEKETGELLLKKEKMGFLNKYLKASYSSGESLVVVMLFCTLICAVNALIEKDLHVFSAIIFMDMVSIAYFLSFGYLKNKENGNSIKNLLLSFVDKNKIKKRFYSMLNLKNSFNRKRYEAYDYELSLRSLEEISKYTSREEMDIILENRVDYQSVHIYNEDYLFYLVHDSKEDVSDYINLQLTQKAIKNKLLSNLYEDKK